MIMKEELNIYSIINRIQEIKKNWKLYVLWMDAQRLLKKVMTYYPQDK